MESIINGIIELSPVIAIGCLLGTITAGVFKETNIQITLGAITLFNLICAFHQNKKEGEMNKKIMKKIFPEKVKRVEMGLCPLCKEKIKKEAFKDIISLKKFNISGMCQKCQNKIFGE